MYTASAPRRGVTLIEYGLLIMLIAILSIGTVTALGGSVTDMFAGLVNPGGSSSETGPGPSEDPGNPLVCASGFEPGSEVLVSYGPINGDPDLASGDLEPVIADANGEITDRGVST